MKSWSFRKKFFVGLIFIIALIGGYNYWTGRHHREERVVSKNEILHLELNGVIMNGKKFLGQLKKYQKDKSIKAIVIDINSPGGAVGPSQEIYYEILRAKQETKKPIICVTTGLMASGGYYSALACDKIVVAPGALVGSIGVIMEFANLEKLYDWAKVSRYTITSGKFKDSGSEYRPMREDERALFQSMINEVYDQFRTTVATARKLDLAAVTEIADGRVMTGATAVKLKLADVEGTFEDAIRLAARTAELGDDYRIFKPKKERPGLMDLLSLAGDDEEDDLNSLDEITKVLAKKSSPAELVKSVMHTQYLNQPLYLMPGYWE
ncbi:MAG: signal peptide peptidase SppA [Bdellovibrio sp.]|nr:signal peptide peptidase SppA [Bdellovibrio sp.]